MARVNWNAPEGRFFDVGLDRGMLYPKGVAPQGEIVARNLIRNPAVRSSNTTPVEVRRNLFKNPSFEGTMLDDVWTYGGSAPELVTVGDAYLGTKVCRINTPPVTGLTSMLFSRTTGNQLTSARFRIRLKAGLTGSRTMSSGFTSYTSAYGSPYGHTDAEVSFNITTSWKEVVVKTNMSSPEGSAWIGLQLRTSNPANGAVAWTSTTDAYELDAVIVSPLSVAMGNPPEYFDGSTADTHVNYTWVGAVNASESVAYGLPEVKKNLTKINPRSGAGWPNNTQWVCSSNQPITGHPLGFTSGAQYSRNPAVNPSEAPSCITSIYGVDGLFDTPTVRFVGTWLKANVPVKANLQIAGGTIAHVVDIPTPNTWVWMQTPSAGNSHVILLVNRLDNSAAESTDRVWTSGTIASYMPSPFFDGDTVDDHLSYVWEGTPNASASVALGKSADYFAGWNTIITQGPVTTGDRRSLEIRSTESGGAYNASNLTEGRYYSARFKIERIPGEGLNNVTYGAILYANTTIASIPDFTLSEAEGEKTIDVVSQSLADGANIGLYIYPRAKGGAIRVWDMQIEQVDGPGKKIETPYFDGSSQSNAFTFEWTGTPNMDALSTKREILTLAVPWNGLVSVDEEGGESASAYYVDGRPFLFLPRPKEYKATLKAYTYPDEFSKIMGVSEIADGMYLDSQMGDSFDLAYRTLVGNSTDGSDHAYKIHLVYNASVSPQANTYETLSNSINPTAFSWEIQAVPIPVEGFRPTAHIIIDTRHMDRTKVEQIESWLYGSEDEVAHIPSPLAIFDLLSYGDTIVVTDNGDGTFDVTGSYENVYLVGPGEFRVDNIDGTDNGDGTFTISTTN